MSIRQHHPPGPPGPREAHCPELAEMKRGATRSSMVTAYDAPAAAWPTRPASSRFSSATPRRWWCSATSRRVPVTMDEMLLLTRAVARGARRPLVVGDMPFGSYQVSDEDAVRNAIRFVKEAGADVVKLEGAGRSLSRVQAIVGAGHPGHGPHRADAAVGDQARRVTRRRDGAPRRRGSCSTRRGRSRPPAASRSCSRQSPPPVAAEITAALSIPTIGIGAGAGCDGQVLVWHDLLGLYEAARRGS